jgi:hypothetical protein
MKNSTVKLLFGLLTIKERAHIVFLGSMSKIKKLSESLATKNVPLKSFSIASANKSKITNRGQTILSNTQMKNKGIKQMKAALG